MDEPGETKDPRYHSRKAGVYESAGDLKRAIAEMGKAIEGNPGLMSYREQMIRLLEKQGDNQEIVIQCDEVIRIRPRDADFRLKKIEALRRMQKLNEALGIYDEITSIYPHDPTYSFLRASFLWEHEQFGQALREIGRAISLDPENPQYYRTRAEILLDTEDLGAAYADYEKSLELSRTDVDTVFHMAQIREVQGRKEEALDLYRRIVDLRPHQLYSYQCLCDFYMSEGNYSGAIEAYNRMTLLDPEKANLYLERGSLYDDLDMTELAVTDYEKYLTLEPSDHGAMEKLALLKRRINHG